MRVLGIDPGSALIGFGVIEAGGGQYRAVDYGVFKLPPKTEVSKRLPAVFAFAVSLIKKYKPEKLAIEKLYFIKNITTAMAVSEARGVIILAAAKNKLRMQEFTPLQIKQAVAAYGRAEKIQVQQMVKMILDLKEIPKPDDAADALAIAICGANTLL